MFPLTGCLSAAACHRLWRGAVSAVYQSQAWKAKHIILVLLWPSGSRGAAARDPLLALRLSQTPALCRYPADGCCLWGHAVLLPGRVSPSTHHPAAPLGVGSRLLAAGVQLLKGYGKVFPRLSHTKGALDGPGAPSAACAQGGSRHWLAGCLSLGMVCSETPGAGQQGKG